MDSRIREIISKGDTLFGARESLLDYWQEIAENFYPERADFTHDHTLGDDRLWLMSSEPVLIRREMANLLQSMLRPESQDWFGIHLTDGDLDQDNEVRRWCEYMTGVQRRAMYHKEAQLSRATKEADNDWVAFGQAAIEVDIRRDGVPGLMYRTGHLRDFAWAENYNGVIDTVHRKWRPTARQLVQVFRSSVDDKVRRLAEQAPDTKINCRRIVLPREDYDFDNKRTPGATFVSIYVDCDNEKVLEEVPILWNPFVIPRWQTVSGSQYAWSPCTGPGLADARTLQAVLRVLLEAGEKAVDPPLIATMEAVRSDINVYRGGITWVDEEYDEKLGAALRPLDQNLSGLPLGLEMADRLNRVLTEGFFINKMRLPQDTGKMTAYEIQKRLEEHIRAASPLLTPAEDEYNAALCERTFEVLRIMKAFGPDAGIPDVIRGQEFRYEFRSPLKDMAEEAKVQQLIDTTEIIARVSAIRPEQVEQVDWDYATADALRGRHVPAKWLVGERKFKAEKARMQKAAQIAQGAQAIQQGADVAGTMAKAMPGMMEQMGAVQ